MAKLHRFFSKEERTLKEERGLKTPEGGEGRTCISFHLLLSPLPSLRALTRGRAEPGYYVPTSQTSCEGPHLR